MMNIKDLANELIKEEEIIFSTDKYLYRVYTADEGIQYDIFSKNEDINNLEDIEILDGGVYELEDLTLETVIEAINYILEE